MNRKIVLRKGLAILALLAMILPFNNCSGEFDATSGSSIVNSVSATHVDLIWDAPTKNVDGTNATVASYVVYIGSESGTYTTSKIFAGGANTARIDNLTPNSTYYIAVSAVGSTGDESDLSNEIQVTTKSN